MPLTPNFSIAQGGNSSEFTLTDSSTGSDVAIVGRSIFLQIYDGTYLVPTGTTNYVDFPLSDGASKVLDVLTQDYSINITVNWLSVTNTVLYTKSALYLFPAHNKQAAYGIVKSISQRPSIIQDTNYFNNLCLLWVYIKNAESANDTGGDISGAQQNIDFATQITDNQTLYF